MNLTKKILILEDNLLVLSKILARLELLEQDQPYSLSLTLFTDHLQVEKYINGDLQPEFDIVLLDRDCKLHGSFHVLDIENIGPEKIIAISSIEEYNEDAKKRGVKRVVQKNMSEIDHFVEQVAKEIEVMLTPKRLLKFY